MKQNLENKFKALNISQKCSDENIQCFSEKLFLIHTNATEYIEICNELNKNLDYIDPDIFCEKLFDIFSKIYSSFCSFINVYNTSFKFDFSDVDLEDCYPKIDWLDINKNNYEIFDRKLRLYFDKFNLTEVEKEKISILDFSELYVDFKIVVMSIELLLSDRIKNIAELEWLFFDKIIMTFKANIHHHILNSIKILGLGAVGYKCNYVN